MKNNYYFLLPENNEQYYNMFRDLFYQDNINIVVVNRKHKNKIYNFIENKIKIWTLKKLPFSNLFLYLLSLKEDLSKLKIDCNVKNVFFTTDQHITPLYFYILKKILNKSSNNRFVVQWLNIVDSVKGNGFLERITDLSPDIIFTDDPGDAKKNNWVFWMDCMSKTVISKVETKSDVFFAGAAKNREEKIIDVYEALSKAELKCDFTIVGGKNQNPNISKTWMGYDELINKDAATNCILEIMQEGQTGYTCRAQEAIVLNKKLLTNNKWISSSRYYNPEFIMIYDSIGKNEIDFVKKSLDVDYKYDDGFSPIKLVEYLEKNI